MVNYPVGIRSLAVRFPSVIKTNNSDLTAHNFLRRTRQTNLDKLDIWSQEVAPFLSDPFRGNVERRVVAPDETSLMLECQAAQDALKAAELEPADIDLAIATSLFPEQIIHGNATDLARKLNLRCPAWNLESTCSSALIALQNAWALIQTGAYRRVLVVTSHIGSNSVDEKDTLAWSMGDAAGAFVVDTLTANQGILGMKIINTGITAGAYQHELITDNQEKIRISTKTGENVSMLAETSVDFVRTCCQEAVASAGLTLEQIDFFAFNTPTAWYTNVCVRALEIESDRTINLYPRYANIGPVFPIANLYHASLEGQIQENDLVLIYTNGAGATAGAIVMRWGDVALGSVPTPPINTILNQKKADSDIPTTVKPIIKTDFSQTQLLAISPQERRQKLEVYLIEILTELLKIPSEQINNQQSFSYLIDSLIALELRRKIEFDLQLSVPMEKFFQDSNINKLVDFLMDKLAISFLSISPYLSSDSPENIEEIIL